MGCETLEKRVSRYGYGSIPINTIFRGMNIHLPAILGFTRYQGFDTLPYFPDPKTIVRLAAANRAPLSGRLGLMFSGKHPAGCLRVSESTSLRDVEGEICSLQDDFPWKNPWFNGFLEIFSHSTNPTVDAHPSFGHRTSTASIPMLSCGKFCTNTTATCSYSYFVGYGTHNMS